MKLTHFYSCCKYVASLSDFSNSSFLQPTEAAKRMQQVVVICFYFSSFISYRSITVVRVCFAKIQQQQQQKASGKQNWSVAQAPHQQHDSIQRQQFLWECATRLPSTAPVCSSPHRSLSLLVSSYTNLSCFFFFLLLLFSWFFFVPSACSLLFSQISANLFALSLCCFADFFRPFFPVLPALAIAAANTLHCKQIYVLLLLLLLLLCK